MVNSCEFLSNISPETGRYERFGPDAVGVMNLRGEMWGGRGSGRQDEESKLEKVVKVGKAVLVAGALAKGCQEVQGLQQNQEKIVREKQEELRRVQEALEGDVDFALGKKSWGGNTGSIFFK